MNDFTISFLCENPTKSQKIYNRWKERTSNILEVYNKDIKTIAHASSGSWRDCIHQSDDDYCFPLVLQVIKTNVRIIHCWMIYFNTQAKRIRVWIRT